MSATAAADVRRPGLAPSGQVMALGTSERDAWAVLIGATGIGPATFARLVRRHGSALAILEMGLLPGGAEALVEAGLGHDRGDGLDSRRLALPPELAEAIVEAARGADAAVGGIRRLGVAVMTSEDPDYPARLLALELPPPVLFVRGERGALAPGQPIAVVGTRRATESGRWASRLIADAIARAGGVVVSGLALGIDGAAHWAAVDAGRPTIAVLGSGHGRLYPRSHDGLAERIVDGGGAVISELAPNTPGTRGTFPRRNRIISGLSRATIVVEAPAKSGALITAGCALEQGRECFIVPGAFGTASAEGALEFLRANHGQARIVSSVGGLLEDLGLLTAGEVVTGSTAVPLGSTEARVAALVAEGVMTVDALVTRTGLPVASVLSVLTLLEMRGLVAAAYGRYRPHGLLMSANRVAPPKRPARAAVTAPGDG